MDPQILLLLMKNNSSNVKNIISTIGIDNLFKLLPDILAIMETMQGAKKP